ncbi:hypothetical protein M378DRAFT_167105 [Amanita muscaria Koide BX008]|uniref:Uncharacterized protein n=1 Tax=Amanita muscaria (strain Koide BX008) TaxID=946122 RepID=A0A0C2SE00_AMAMK|nr:hypothetical protein M378DRAFT_167105 [Amanita muscaria Koide BX008]
MDPQSIPPRAGASAVRPLPSYDDVNVPYSLRLPAYRSSYMRRYHPYPRYYTPTQQHDTDISADEPLDLSILEVPILPPIIHPAAPDAVQNVNNVQEQANAAQEIQEGNEEPVAVVDPGVVYANPEPQDEEGNQAAPFLRVEWSIPRKG